MSSLTELRALLAAPGPHGVATAAHAARTSRHGARTTFAAVAQVDPVGAHERCPLTGGRGPFARSLDEVSERVTDLLLLPEPGAGAAGLRAALDLLAGPPPTGVFAATVQVGSADDWIGHESLLGEASGRGVRVISESIAPRVHPARGADGRWESFWRAAAHAGLRGHAVLLYGDDLDPLAQVERIESLQKETRVFLSVAPVIAPAGAPADDDASRTHASADLRALAACRLGAPSVEHVTVRYERGDLKSAHAALVCGADDLFGRLFLGDRDRRADAEARDLSLREMPLWLAEAGLEPLLRNGCFETLAPSQWMEHA